MSVKWDKEMTKQYDKENSGQKRSGSLKKKREKSPIKVLQTSDIRNLRAQSGDGMNVKECNGVGAGSFNQKFSCNNQKKHKRTASLTDLRPEDKKKVANLIQELGRLGSEKQKIEELLKKERSDFETAIKELVSDQKKLLSERQLVQTELVTCQRMLNQLQDAVLSKPVSLVTTESETNAATCSDSTSDRRPTVLDKVSDLDTYIINHHSIQESMDVCSEVGSEISESNQRISSTVIGENSSYMATRRGQSRCHLGDGDKHHKSYSEHSTINYSRKEELNEERARLLEEQKQLRQRLMEQEELLRKTQQRLYQREQEQANYFDKLQYYQDAEQMEQTSSHNSQRLGSSAASTSSYPRHARSYLHTPLSQGKSYTSVATESKSTSPMANSQAHLSHSLYDIAVQVTSPESSTHNLNKSTKDTSVQAELPIVTKCYVGNRLVPSPRENNSRNNSLDETLEKTSKLLQSARKIIDEAKSPIFTNSSRSSSRPSSKHQSRTPSSCHHSYRSVTPRKTPQELFDISEATLASDINNDKIQMEVNDSTNDADQTELEMLGDIFYVR